MQNLTRNQIIGVLAGVAAGLATVVIVPVVALQVAARNCRYVAEDEIVSPSGAWKAALANFQCFGPADGTTKVVVTRAGSAFDMEADVVAFYDGGLPEIAWRENGLEVIHDGGKFLERKAVKDGVAITYVARQPAADAAFFRENWQR